MPMNIEMKLIVAGTCRHTLTCAATTSNCEWSNPNSYNLVAQLCSALIPWPPIAVDLAK